MTLDDLERPKRPLAEIKSCYGAFHKNFNEDRRTLSAAKCRRVIVVYKNIKYMRIWGLYRKAVLWQRNRAMPL